MQEEMEFSIQAARELAFTLVPRSDVLERIEQEAFPLSETLLGLAGPNASVERVLRNASEFVPFSHSAVERPGAQASQPRPLSLAAAAGMLGLSGAIAARNWTAAVRGDAASLEPRLSAAAMDSARMPGHVGSTDPIADLLSHTGCAPQQRLPLFPPRCNPDDAASRPVSYQAFAALGATQLPAYGPAAANAAQIRTQATHLFALNFAAEPRHDLRLRSGFVAEPLTGQAILPNAKLGPAKLKGVPGSALDPALLQQDPPARRMAANVADFWNHAPRDLKILLFAVPLALGLAFHPSLPKVSVQAPGGDAKAVTGQFKEVLGTQWAGLRKSMADRAAVGLDENFRQGLDNWMSHSGSTAEWSFDQAGFVQPGRVALYQPSLGLSDYEFQFLGAIDKGALSWVARASDFQNYYVVKLVTVKGGPVPEMGITRYAVINGQPVDRVDTPVTFQARTDSLYRVSMVMEGDHYSLVIQGQMIDSWKEPRLKRGGIGFFTNRGEQSRIGWVQITHQYDMLGRLFAYLAP
jgi:hypothetical protein